MPFSQGLARVWGPTPTVVSSWLFPALFFSSLDLDMWVRAGTPQGPGVTQPHVPPAVCAGVPALLIARCPSCAWASAMFPHIHPGVHPLMPPPTSRAATPPLWVTCLRWLQFPHPITDGFRPHGAGARLRPPWSDSSVTDPACTRRPDESLAATLSPHTCLPQDPQQQHHEAPRCGPAPWLPGPLLRPHADQG